MPDIDIFDAAMFFESKIRELHEQIEDKKTRLEIHTANRRNVGRTLAIMNQLEPAAQRALQIEFIALQEALESNEKAIETLEGEISVQCGKLQALMLAKGMAEVAARPEG